MRPLIRQSLSLFLVMTALCGVLYPLAVTGLAQLAFPRQANGSLIVRDGQVLGSRLIGQRFRGADYFWSRPSATAPYPYDAEASSGSNLGPTNPALRAAVARRVAALRAANPAATGPIPADLVTASGSGLDPDITPAAAQYQLARVARARHLSTARVQAMIDASTRGRQLGVLGEPRVNVLELNLRLDGLWQRTPAPQGLAR